MDEKIRYYIKIGLKFVGFATIVFGIFLSYQVARFYLPFIIALFIASMAEPLIRKLMETCKIKRKMASIISLLIILSIIIIVCSIIISSLIAESSKLIGNLNNYATQAYNWGIEIFEDVKEGRIQIPTQVIQMVENSYGGIIDALKNFLGNFFTGLITTIGAVPTWITYGITTILAVLFICFDRDYVIQICKKHIPSKWLEKTREVIAQTCQITWRYIKAEAKLSGICFILILFGLLLMSFLGITIEYPIIMAIFIGFMDLLPIFGAGTVMIPWSIYLVVTNNLPAALAVAVLWIIWAVIKNLVEPKMISQQMGMHPIFTLLAMYTGFKLLGVIGLILGPILFLVITSIFKELIAKGVLKTIFEQE